MTTNRIRHLVAVGLAAAVVLAATSGAVFAPARGEGSSMPAPVERVAREVRTGAKSVIVSAGGKEYVPREVPAVPLEISVFGWGA